MKHRLLPLPEMAILAASISAGLFGSRTAAGLLYQQYPQLLDRPLAIAIAGSVALAMWLSCRFACRRSGSDRVAAKAAPAIALAAVFWLPFPDHLWSLAVLGATLLPLLFQVLSRLDLRWETGGSLVAQVAAIGGAAIAFAFYLRTMAPSVVEGDSSEFQSAAYTLGIAHPTGYPLYLLLGKAFTYLPWGNVAYRVNLLSGVCAAVAVYVLILTCGRLVDARFALIAGLTLGFTSVFWSQAVVAEVYALSALLFALILYFIVSYVQATATQKRPHLAWMWLVFGFGLAHHRTILLMAPALLACTLLALRDRQSSLVRVTVAAGLGALPLALYAYLPIRWGAEYGRGLDWPAFQWHVLASGYSFALRLDSLLDDPGRYGYVLGLFQSQLTWPALLLALVGLAALLRHRVRLAQLLLLSLAAVSLFPVAYHVPDVAVFSLPALIVLSVFVACGTNSAATTFGKLAKRIGWDTSALVVALAALGPAYLLSTGLAANDRSSEYALDAWGKAALAQSVPAGSLVVSDMPHNSALRYFFGVEAPDRGLKTAMPDSEAEARAIISDTLASRHPVYLARFVPGLDGYVLDASGPLVSVSTGAPPKSAATGEMPLAPGIGLAGFELGSPEVAAGEAWSLTLRWHNDLKLSENFNVHLRLLDGAGQVAYSARPGAPVRGMYPTYAWPAGSLVNDFRELAIPEFQLPGIYRVQVGLGAPFRAPERWSDVGVVAVKPQLQAPNGRLLAVFDKAFALVAVNLNERVTAGSAVRARLRWARLKGSSDQRATIEIELEDGVDGRRPLVGSKTLLTDSHGSWSQSLDLPLAKDLRPGTYRLMARLTTEDGQSLPAISGWAAEKSARVPVGEIVVSAPPQEALTNLENEVILVWRELEGGALKPGGKVRLVLHWQAAAKMAADYTVFVHLLDVNGKVRSQVDAYPLAGLRPTSQWRPGDEIADAYELPLPPDLTPGRYQIEVGMYRAANMQRLLVIDSDQQPVDDRVLVGPVEVLPK